MHTIFLQVPVSVRSKQVVESDSDQDAEDDVVASPKKFVFSNLPVGILNIYDCIHRGAAKKVVIIESDDDSDDKPLVKTLSSAVKCVISAISFAYLTVCIEDPSQDVSQWSTATATSKLCLRLLLRGQLSLSQWTSPDHASNHAAQRNTPRSTAMTTTKPSIVSLRESKPVHLGQVLRSLSYFNRAKTKRTVTVSDEDVPSSAIKKLVYSHVLCIYFAGGLTVNLQRQSQKIRNPG